MLNLVLFGPPGAGKGTQAEKVIEKYELVHFSTGDILRNELASSTELGLEAKKYMDKGELVPDEVVIGMIDAKVERNKAAKGFVFDGFPRTIQQAEALDELLNKKGLKVSGLIVLEVDHDELVKRLVNRGKDSGREDDKDVSIIENRIQVYEKKTMPVVEYYKKANKYYPVKGVGEIDEIFQNICAEIDKLNN